MNEQLIRAIVRETLARTAGAAPGSEPTAQPITFARHGSHYRYHLSKGGSACLIEPAVQCNDCGYCESHGH